VSLWWPWQLGGEGSGWVLLSLALLSGLLASVPFLLWRRARLFSPLVFIVVLLIAGGQASSVSSEDRGELLALLVLFAVSLYLPVLLLRWPSTRRLGLAWVGLTVISCVSWASYMLLVLASIGYVLLLLALWPRWRLLYPVSRGREVAPVAPSRGALRVHAWPRNQGGFTLVSSLVGVFCLLVAFALAGQVVSSAMTAVRRANHLARATDLLTSARERTLLGQTPGDLSARAKRDLPEGTATLARTPSGPGLVQVTATARWREVDGRPGEMTLVWLTREGAR
jgi:hypothetical protein